MYTMYNAIYAIYIYTDIYIIDVYISLCHV